MPICEICGRIGGLCGHRKYHPPVQAPEYIREEPSYMMFARANVRDHQVSSPAIVQALLNRIDRLESEKEEVQP